MKILNITAQKPDSTGSGVYLSELVNNFLTLAHEQAVIAGIFKDDIVNFNSNVEFYPIYYNSSELPFPIVGMSDSMPYESTKYNELSPQMAQQFENTFIYTINKVINSWKPELIICHHLYFLTALVREHFPNEKIVGICHGTDLRQYQKTTLQNKRIKENISKLDHIFALHDNQKEEISNLYSADVNKITVIGSGYNHLIFKEMHLKKEEKIKKIIYAGKICEKKGVISLLNSINNITSTKYPFKLLLAGGYSDELEYNQIKKMAQNCQIEVEFLGKLTQLELAHKFNECDIFILPSFFEGLPLVIIEALACGLKVIATDLPGIKDWISKNVKNSGISFVTPPQMSNVDEPNLTSLEAFEESLMNSIVSAVNADNYTLADTKNVQWIEVCKRILNAIK